MVWEKDLNCSLNKMKLEGCDGEDIFENNVILEN